MMNYLSNRPDRWQISRRRKNKKSRLFLLAIVLLIFLAISGVFGPFSSLMHKIATPIWRAGDFFKDKASGIGYFFTTKKKLADENVLLKERLSENEIQLLFQNVLFDENQELKGILKRSEDILKEDELFILGSILSKPNSSPYDILVIDLGKNSSIQKGDYVFAKGNILIGQIEEVFKKSSKVKLFSTPGEKIDAVLSGEDIYTTLSGRGGGNFEMTLPRDVSVEEGTQVVLPGITPYLVATVKKINYDPRDPLQNVLLRSPVNIQQLKFVQILRTTNNQ